MNPPAPTPAPLHDIAGPVSILSNSLTIAVLAVLGGLAVLGLIVWLTRRRRMARPLTAREKALAAFEALRREQPEADPYAFGVRVSDALRTYIRDRFGLDAVTRTSVEFLEILRDHRAFSESEKVALSDFLESADLLKYARQSAAVAEINTLLDIAERLVRGEAPVAAPVTP